jgi:hypothetical protein
VAGASERRGRDSNPRPPDYIQTNPGKALRLRDDGSAPDEDDHAHSDGALLRLTPR